MANSSSDVGSKDDHQKRNKQMQAALGADVMINEAFESGGSNMSDSNSNLSEDSSDNLMMPSEKEIQHYTRRLNNPGEIQSHGALLLVDEKDGYKIVAASSNCKDVLNKDPHELLWGVIKGENLHSTATDRDVDVSSASTEAPTSQHSAHSSQSSDVAHKGTPMTLLDLFDEKQRIETALTLKNLDLANPVTVSISKSCEGDIGGSVNLILSRVKGLGLLIDIEPQDPTENAFVAHQKVRGSIDRVHQFEKVPEMCQEVCGAFKDMYNYNRVMIYKFHEDFHGEVVAECLDPGSGQDSYMGLHYPATDLPQRTRDQLVAEHVRTLVDAKAGHATIITCHHSLPPSAIGLGTSTLRRAHKCHLEYLDNMGVTASIAVAVIVRGQLWGLMIGHHWTPKFISYQMRMAGDFLAQAFSMRLTSLLDKKNHEQHRTTLELHASLCSLMSLQGFNPGLRLRGLVSPASGILDLVAGVCGATVSYMGKISSVGMVPSDKALLQITAAIDVQWQVARQPQGVPTSWDRLGLLLHDGRGANQCAGLLAVPVVDEGQLIFFRPELSTTIRWAGDPKKYAKREEMTGALHPRASFEIYTDSVRGQCVPWHKRDLDAAAGMALLVNDLASTGGGGSSEANASAPRGGSVEMGVVMEDGMASRMQDGMPSLMQHDMRSHTRATADTLEETKRLMDSVQAPVFGVDMQFNVVQWNSMCEKLSGYTKQEMMGTSILDITIRAGRSAFAQVLHKTLALAANESGDGSFEVSFVKARAEKLPEIARQVEFLTNATCNFDLGGKVTGVQCVCQDITSNRIPKDSQDVLSSQLEQIVLSSTQVLKGMPVKLTDAKEEQFEFYPDKTGSLLGEGAFGKTYKMRNTIDSELYAVKMIKVAKMQKGGVAVEALKREVHMLLQLNCPYIVRYFTCFMRKHSKYFCIVMELADGGTLTNLVKDLSVGNKPIDPHHEELFTKYLTQMAIALEQIHSKRMLHRDLKPDNVLFSLDASEIKISDFGLACVASSDLGVISRAGTLTYSSPEKASSKAYGSKDDIWALGCIMSELLTGISLSQRCAGGVMAFNSDLIARVVRDCEIQSKRLGKIVSQLLAYDPEKRPSAAEIIALVGPPRGGQGSALDAAHELCADYMCNVCNSLVVDAQSGCLDEHVFCYLCLDSALASNANTCPTCGEEALKLKTQRVVNNMAEKLAKRVLGPQDIAARLLRLAESKNKRLQRAKEQTEAMALIASEKLLWTRISGKAQLGSACTVFRHTATGSAVEVFHVNGWFRFRNNGAGSTKWCNSCCVIGDSDWGAPMLVKTLDETEGEAVEVDGVFELNESDFWESRIINNTILLTNVDDETLVLQADGAMVWLSHEGMNKGLLVRPAAGLDIAPVQVLKRNEALQFLGVDSAEALGVGVGQGR